MPSLNPGIVAQTVLQEEEAFPGLSTRPISETACPASRTLHSVQVLTTQSKRPSSNDCVYLPPKWVASHPGIAAAPVA